MNLKCLRENIDNRTNNIQPNVHDLDDIEKRLFGLFLNGMELLVSSKMGPKDTFNF